MNLTASPARGLAWVIAALAAVTCVSILASFGITSFANRPGTTVSPTDGYKQLNSELADCIDRTIRVSSIPAMTFDRYSEVWRLCENQMYDQLLLNDYSIRRQKFAENGLDERVNLWLVVAITLSGVVLSAMQLVMSYRLAQLAKTGFEGNNELVVEQGKLSLKSSVTGLMIMAISLIFFFVYVKWIYMNYDISSSRPGNLTAERPAGKMLSNGSLGAGPRSIAPAGAPAASSGQIPAAPKPGTVEP